MSSRNCEILLFYPRFFFVKKRLILKGQNSEPDTNSDNVETLDEFHVFILHCNKLILKPPKKTQIQNSESIYVGTVSVMTIEYFEPLVSETLDVALEKCVPRPRPPEPLKDNRWKFKESIFKNYKRDDEVSLLSRKANKSRI